jgi:hypothetical protein
MKSLHLYKALLLGGIALCGSAAFIGLYGLLAKNIALGWVGVAQAFIGVTAIGYAVPKMLKELNK